jgi:hypothetical protein
MAGLPAVYLIAHQRSEQGEACNEQRAQRRVDGQPRGADGEPWRLHRFRPI